MQDPFFETVIQEAINQLHAQPIDLYTVAFYFDHDSAQISICADTLQQSKATVRLSNQWNMKYFYEHIASGSLEDAELFQANVGRSLSLGDFARVHVAAAAVPPRWKEDETMYLQMIRALTRHQRSFIEMASHPEDLLFCCSSPRDEVGYVWVAN